MQRERNEALTRVEGDAPMGRMLRDWYWIPALRSARVEAGAPPERVRFFGENLVVFRDNEGRIGVLAEACPHRGASLALANNDGTGVRCVYHGWKFTTAGKLVDVPNQPDDPDEFASRVRVTSYRAHDAGGVIWLYMGSRTMPPQFPELPFTRLKAENLVLANTVINCNWAQSLDGAMDSAHVGMLHQSYLGRVKGGHTERVVEAIPQYEVEHTAYGLRAAAIRAVGDEHYVRVTTFVMPWYGLTPPGDPANGDRTALISVPVDDTHTLQWFIRFNVLGKPADPTYGWNITGYDIDNFTPLPDAASYWGQDRQAVRKGHFTGFTQHHLAEDSAVQVSMGPIVDRSIEHLTKTDVGVANVRRILLQSLDDAQAGKAPLGTDPGIAFEKIQADVGVLPANKPWREVFPG